MALEKESFLRKAISSNFLIDDKMLEREKV